jgi:proteasome assembly chaperone (PAC2) family protein
MLCIFHKNFAQYSKPRSQLLTVYRTVAVNGVRGSLAIGLPIIHWSVRPELCYSEKTMEALIFESRPTLKNPVLLLSFAGWSDAGASASTAVRYLIDQLLGKKFAAIDPEEFYDFYRQRPVVRLNDRKEREIHWPSYDFYYGPGIGVEKDFVLGIGAEPHLRWRTFTETMLRFAHECQAEMVITLGAYLDEVLYTRPVPLTGFSTDPQLVDQLDLVPSRYQGPTGIVGVLADACRAAGVPHVSLWASLPHYLSVSPNPRGTLALLLRLSQWLGLRVDTGPLERAAADFQAKINEAVNADPKLSAFVRELKKREFEQ